MNPSIKTGNHQPSQEEASYFFSHAFIGKELEHARNVIFHVKEGFITEIEISARKTNADYSYPFTTIAFPRFVNGHVHSLDYFLKGLSYSKTLEQLVSPQGLKNIALEHASQELMIKHSKQYFSLLEKLGYRTVFDFREKGVLGIQMGIESVQHTSLKYFPLGRPLTREESEILQVLQLAQGLGIPDMVRYDLDFIKHMAHLTKTSNKLVAIHISESMEDKKFLKSQGVDDIPFALEELKADLLVHLTHATSTDFEFLEQYKHKTTYVLCPRANTYFKAGTPPLWELISRNVPFLLGTDNSFTITPSMLEELRYALLIIKTKGNVFPIKSLAKASIGLNTPFPAPYFEKGQEFAPQVFKPPFYLTHQPLSQFLLHIQDKDRVPFPHERTL